jgi:hypothetical protein
MVEKGFEIMYYSDSGSESKGRLPTDLVVVVSELVGKAPSVLSACHTNRVVEKKMEKKK